MFLLHHNQPHRRFRWSEASIGRSLRTLVSFDSCTCSSRSYDIVLPSPITTVLRVFASTRRAPSSSSSRASNQRRPRKPRPNNNTLSASTTSTTNNRDPAPSLSSFFAYLQQRLQPQSSSEASDAIQQLLHVVTSTTTTTPPPGFWRITTTHKLFLEWAGNQLGINNDDDDDDKKKKNLDGWYAIIKEDIMNLGGGGLLQQYNNSLQQALYAAYPEHEWLPWRFQQTSKSFWSDPANHKRFMDWAGKQLGINTNSNGNDSGSGLDGWYAVTKEDIAKLGGGGLLQRYYNNSLQQALAAVYPHHEWLPWRFHHTSKAFWRDRANHKRFMDWAGKQLGIDSSSENGLDGWYSVITEDVEKLGGSGLLQCYYNNSLQQALSAVYPQHEWQPWRFHRSFLFSFDSAGKQLFNNADDAMKAFVEHLAAGLGIKQLDDWYRVSQQQICDAGLGPRAARTIKRHGGLYAVLRRVYPEHAWAEDRFEHHKGKKAAQRWLFFVVAQKLFPNTEVIEEFTHPTLKFTKSGRNLTLDVYVPSLSLAFEYQGVQHYRYIRGFYEDVTARQEREAEKDSLCAKSGITVVPVPYWWDRTADDLVATIREFRPDLFELPTPPSDGTTAQQQAAYDTAVAMTLRLQAAAARGRPIPQKPPQPRPQRNKPNSKEAS